MMHLRTLALVLINLTNAASENGRPRNGDQCPDLASNDHTEPLFQVRNWLHALNSEQRENGTLVADDAPWIMHHASFYDKVALMKVRIHTALGSMGSWRMYICVGTGLLLSLAFILVFVNTSVTKSNLAWHIGLTIAIAASWVGIAQLARVALAGRSKKSLVLLLVWANGAMWLFLGIPHLLQKLRAGTSSSTLRDACTSEVFKPRHTAQFWFIAFVTNSAYIAALGFLSASLNTAVFSTTAIFTFGLSLGLLTEDATSKGMMMRSISLRLTFIGLSVFGVMLISEAWNQASASLTDRLTGVGLSLVAALGTSVYQVVFKHTFGSTMTPEVVGLFLAHLGAVTIVFYGAVLFGGICIGAIDIDLTAVPWMLVALTSVSSAIFNFLIKFGIVYSSPLTVSLATQLGIPLNLGLDVLIVGAEIDGIQAVGVILMLASFSVNVYVEQRKVTDTPGVEQN